MLDEVHERLARLQHPVGDQDGREGDHRRALQSHHGVDPLADAAVLLEVLRVHEVHAAGPRHVAVDDDDLAVHAQIGASDERAKQPYRQGPLHAHARLAQPSRLAALPPWPRTDGVDEHAAVDVPLGGADQRLEHLVGGPALVPDVELHEHAAGGAVDLARDLAEDGVRVRDDAEAAAAHGGYAHGAHAQPVHGLRNGAMAGPVHIGEALVGDGLEDSVTNPLELTDAPRPRHTDAALSHQQVYGGAEERQQGDDDQPRQRHPRGRSPHDHAHRDHQDDEQMRRLENRCRVQQEVEHGPAGYRTGLLRGTDPNWRAGRGSRWCQRRRRR